MAEAGRGVAAPPPSGGAPPAASVPPPAGGAWAWILARSPGRAWSLTLALVGGLLFLRVLTLFVSPLELYPDEAQYWVWSRRLGLGYFSKPPLIAWAIRATTALGASQDEAWVRLSAPLFHAAAALALARAGMRLYGPAAGLIAALVYSLMPGVQLSSAVIATDAPLMAFLAVAVWAYAAFWTAEGADARRRAAAPLGLALGLAMLAKYAALYVGLGVLLHAAISPEARRRWDRVSIVLAAGVLLLVLAPNLGWNLTHGLSTLVHTADAADWGSAEEARPARSLLDPRQAPGFLLSQFGVFGPVPFAVLLIGGVGLFRRGARSDPQRGADLMLLCLALPALAVALAEAAIARANANWAAAAYAAGSVLAAGWLVRWRARRALVATLGLQGLLAAAFLLVFARPELADGAGLGNSLKRARGWSATTRAVLERAGLEGATAGEERPSAIAADDRFLFNALSYYGRETLARPGAPPLKMWVREVKARNEAEASDPLLASDRGRVLVAAMSYPAEAAADFETFSDVERLQIPLDAKRRFELTLFDGLGFRPLPRDPRTGRPYPAAPLP
jgi:4-amino-4-deoxy-L-arabinose transferase-like glycosyltransferase